MEKLRRVVDQFGNQVRMSGVNELLFFTEDNQFMRVNDTDENNYNIRGDIFYQVATNMTGKRK